MSLRRDVHNAFDVIAPPLGGMPERVVQTVLADHNARRRKERMLVRFRTPLSLVAVFLLIALVVAVLIGGRVVQDWNAFHKPVPAGPPQVTVADLEARPWVLPQVAPGGACPGHQGTNEYGFDYGDGPVYGNGGNVTTTPWGHLYDVTYFTKAGLKGPILVRGKDLQSTLLQGFVSSAAIGPIAGVDPTQNPSTLRSELVLDPSNPPSRYNGFGAFPVRQGLPMGWKGCFGIQMDGPTFTETIYGFDSSYTATS